MKKRTKFLFGILAMSAFLMVQAPTVGKAFYALGTQIDYAARRQHLRARDNQLVNLAWASSGTFWATAAGLVGGPAGVIASVVVAA